jgi:hypothetical protein
MSDDDEDDDDSLQIKVFMNTLRAGRGSITGRGKGFFLYLLCSDQLSGPASLLFKGYRGSFPWG